MDEDITDEQLDRIAARIRSIRRRESLAKLVGAALALVLGGGLFLGSFLVLPGERTSGSEVAGAYRTYRSNRGLSALRFGLGALGVMAGAFAYRKLSPKEDPNDVE
ncbi:MAG: hypothetical protein AB7S26_35740 [Sandaracinaceae bacterium]